MVSFTVYCPGEEYLWAGFCEELLLPSPKSHDQLYGELVLSVKLNTCEVSQASVMFAEKEGFGIPYIKIYFDLDMALLHP